MNKLYYLSASLMTSILIISCSSDEPSVITAQPTVVIPTEVPLTISNDDLQPESPSTNLPAPTNVPIKVKVSPAEPTPEPTPVKKTANIFDAFGFILTLDADSDIWNSNLVQSGLLEGTPNNNQGVISFEYKGVDTSLIWAPAEGESNEELVEFGYFILSDSQPQNVFTPLNSGGIKVAESDGSFAGFIISDSSGSDAGGGLIAGWNCSNGISYTLVTTGPDSTALQIRFNNIVSGFTCE
jgi:hypothetical protein